MGQSISYPDGSVLSSSALTQQQINDFMQPLTLGMWGQTVADDSPLVRITYPIQGQPFQDATEDVCYLTCTSTGDDNYTKIRDRSNLPATDPNLLESWRYTRVWRVKWCFYGPNCFDNARAIRSALFQDYFTSQLSQKQLFPVSDFPDPIRAPELIDGQWFDRTDFQCDMYEYVTETIKRQTVSSVEVIVENSDGEIADITVSTT